MDPVDKAVLASLFANNLDPSISAYDRVKARLPVSQEFFRTRLSHLGKLGFVEKDDPTRLTFIGRDALRVVLVGGVFVEDLVRTRYALIDQDMRAGPDGFFVHSQVELLGQWGGAQPELLTGLELQRIVDHDFGELFNAGIGHAFS